MLEACKIYYLNQQTLDDVVETCQENQDFSAEIVLFNFGRLEELTYYFKELLYRGDLYGVDRLLRSSNETKIVFCGGSSITVSVDGFKAFRERKNCFILEKPVEMPYAFLNRLKPYTINKSNNAAFEKTSKENEELNMFLSTFKVI